MNTADFPDSFCKFTSYFFIWDMYSFIVFFIRQISKVNQKSLAVLCHEIITSSHLFFFII